MSLFNLSDPNCLQVVIPYECCGNFIIFSVQMPSAGQFDAILTTTEGETDITVFIKQDKKS